MNGSTDLDSLGRLKKVPLREVWGSESTDFTPWLSSEGNLQLLGETLGIELELEASEQQVGPFRADILCNNSIDASWVLIENQLERTDHLHLGQLLTYAAGLDAVTIVWIADRFTEEHRAALDWLNEITDPRFNFFGIEVELWQIGDSPCAPKFNLVSKPNKWKRGVSASAAVLRTTDLSDAKRLQQKYWEAFKVHSDSSQTLYRATKGLPQNFMNIAIGRSGVNLVAICSFFDNELQSWSSNEIRAELYIQAGENTEFFYDQLERVMEDIHQELGYQLTWHVSDQYLTRRLYLRKTVNLQDESDWASQHQWLSQRLDDLYRVLKPRVKALMKTGE